MLSEFIEIKLSIVIWHKRKHGTQERNFAANHKKRKKRKVQNLQHTNTVKDEKVPPEKTKKTTQPTRVCG